jgi:outer membrane protein OmpA-like peptidoglycan-associated protein
MAMFQNFRNLFFLLPLCLGQSHAQAEEINFGKNVPSADKILDYLVAPAENDEAVESAVESKDGIKTRGLIFVKQKDKRPLAHKPITPSPVQNQKALSLEILFAYNSAELTAEGQQQLRPVGEALTNAGLKDKRFIIEGHTDVVGSDQYNVELSRRRAEAVKAFLLSQYGLPDIALNVEGVGKRNLAKPDEPTSEANRRVRIVMLSE